MSSDYMELSLLQKLTEASELEALAESRTELRKKKAEIASLRRLLPLSPTATPQEKRYGDTRSESPHHRMYAGEGQQSAQLPSPTSKRSGRASPPGVRLGHLSPSSPLPTSQPKQAAKPSMATYAHLSPTPQFRSTAGLHRTGAPTIDGLIEEVTHYIRHGSDRNSFDQNLIGNPDSFSSTFAQARENLLNPDSKAPSAFQEMSPDELYNVLSAAFMMMEEERGRFKKGLEEVERFYKSKLEDPSPVLKRVMRSTRSRLLRVGFTTWAMNSASVSTTAKGKFKREKRLTNNTRRQIERMLFSLLRKTFHAWEKEVGKGKLRRYQEQKETLRSEVEGMKIDITNLVSTREEFSREQDSKVLAMAAQLELFKDNSKDKALKNMKKYVMQWTHKLLIVTINGWKTYVRKSKSERLREEGMIRRWMSGTKGRCWQRWKEYVQDEKRNRYILAKYSQRVREGTKLKAYSKWVDFWVERREARRVMGRMIGGRRKEGLRKGWGAWSEVIKYERIKDRVEKRVEEGTEENVKEIKNSLEAQMQKARERKKKLGLKMIQTMVMGCVAESFRCWRNEVKERKARRERMKRFGNRWRLQTANRVVNTWKEKTKTRKFLRTIIARMLRMREGKGVKKFFGIWIYATMQAGKGDLEETLRDVRERAAKGLEREENMRNELSHLQSKMVIFKRSVGEEKVKEGERKKQNAFRVIHRWKSESLRRCWVGWKEGARRLKEERMLLDKFSRKLRMGSAGKVFRQWSFVVKDEKKKRILIMRFRRRYEKGGEIKVWMKWNEFVAIRKRARGITRRIVGGRDKEQLGRGFRKWTEGVREERESEDTQRKVEVEKTRKQAVAFKYVMSLIHGAMGKAFRGWREWSKEERAKRNLVLGFIKRMKNRTLINGWNGWVDKVGVRKRMRIFVNRMLNSKDLKDLAFGLNRWKAAVAEMGLEGRERVIKMLRKQLNEAHEVSEELRGAVEMQRARIEMAEGSLGEEQKKMKEIKMKNARGLMQTWKNKTLNTVFGGWKKYTVNKIRGNEVVSRFVTKWVERDTAMAFLGWRDGVREMVRLEKLTIKYAQRLLKNTLWKCLAAWRAEAKRALRYRVLVGRFRIRLLHARQMKVWRTWEGFVDERKRMRTSAIKFIKKKENRELAMGFNGWLRKCQDMVRWEVMGEVDKIKERERVANLKRNTELVLRSIQSFINQSVSSSFHLWKAMVLEERHNKVVVERYVKRWKGMYVMKCFITWVDYVIERRELRGVVKKFLGGKETKMISGGFRSWKTWVIEEKERERVEEKERLERAVEESKKRGNEAEILAKKNEEEAMARGENAARNMFATRLKGMRFTCFNAWKEETRKNKLIKTRMGGTFKRMMHQDLARGWQKWVGGIRTLNRNLLGEVKTERQKAEMQLKLAREDAKRVKDGKIKRVMIGWTRKELKLALTFWKSEVDEFVRHEQLVKKYASRLLRGGLCRILERWKDFVKTEKRHRHVIKMFKLRYENGTQLKVMNSWREFTRKNKTNSVIVARFRARVMNSTLARAYSSWVGLWATRRRMKELTNRIFKRLLNQGISRGWVVWISYVEELRKEDYVVRLFVKRWRNLIAYKVFKGWSQHVKKARWDTQEGVVVVGIEEMKAAGGKLKEMNGLLEVKKQEVAASRQKVLEGGHAQAEVRHFETEIKQLDEHVDNLTQEVFDLEGKVEDGTKRTKDCLVKRIAKDKIEVKLVKAKSGLKRGKVSQQEVNELELELYEANEELERVEKDATAGEKNHAAYVSRQVRDWRVGVKKSDVEDEDELRELEELVGPLIPLPDTPFADEAEAGAKAVVFAEDTEHVKEKKREVERLRTKVKRGLVDPSELRKAEAKVEGLERGVVAMGEEVATSPFGTSPEIAYLAGSVTLHTTSSLLQEMKVMHLQKMKAVVDAQEHTAKLLTLEGELQALEGETKNLEKEFAKAKEVVKVSESNAEAAAVAATSRDPAKGAFVLSGGGKGGESKHTHVTKHRHRAQSRSNWDDAKSTTSEGGISALARDLSRKNDSGRGDGWSKPVQSILVMSKEHETQVALARIEKKKTFHRERFNELEVLAKIDRAQVVSHLIGAIACLDDLGSIKYLLKNVFRTRKFHGHDKAFKVWAIGSAMRKREKQIGVSKVYAVVKAFGKKKMAKAFNRMRRAVMVWKSDYDKVEFAAKTKIRLRTQAAQVIKAREESLRVGRSMLKKLTANTRTNLLVRSFGALKKARAMKIKALSLVRRWIMNCTQGSVHWAFHSWRAKVNAAEAFSSRSAFLAAADAEVRAQLAFTLNRFWMKKDVGNFGFNARADKRRAYLRWKHWFVKELERERVWREVEARTRGVSNVLSLMSGLRGERGKDEGEDNFTYNDAIYKGIKKYLLQICNPGSSEGEDGEGEEDDVVRGCLIVCKDDKFVIYDKDKGGLCHIPVDTGVIGGLMAGGTFGVSKQILSDPRYEELADDLVLSAAGRPVFEMERQAAKRFQSLAMKTSNVMSRATISKSSRTGKIRGPGDRSGSVVVGVGPLGGGGLGGMSAVSTNVKIPDLAMMAIPIKVGEGTIVGAVVGIGRREIIGEATASNLSMVATAVAGGFLSLYK